MNGLRTINFAQRNLFRGAQIISTRSVVYISGRRVRGAVRNPEDYLTNFSGRKYDENASEQLVSNLKQYLSRYDINNIPNSLLLQVMTHKSFAHGKKPFNEKLSIFGRHLLKETSSVYLVESEVGLSQINDSSALVEGLNFEILGTRMAKAMLHKAVLAQFIRFSIPGIEKEIFWKKANALYMDPQQSGENVVLYDTLNALVGAVNCINGKEAAEEFIRKALLSGEHSLVELAEAYMKSEQSYYPSQAKSTT